MKILRYIIRHISEILWTLTAIGVLALVMLFVNFNAKIADNIQRTKDVVQGQTEILTAIQQVTKDTNLTAQQQTNIIICMLQVPVAQRTTDLQTQCKKQGVAATPSSASGNNAGSSSNQTSPINTTPPSTPSQSNNSQQKGDSNQPVTIPTPLGVISLCVPFTNVCITE